MKSKYKNLFQNIGIFTLASFTTKILSFLILPLYTYYLSTAEYGTIDLLNTFIQLLYPVFTLAIVDAVLRFGISDKKNIKEIFTVGCRIIIWGSVILLIGCGIFAAVTGRVIIAGAFMLIYVSTTFNALAGSFAKAIDKTKEMAIITTVTSFVILLLNVLFVAVLKQGINGYWCATILGNVIGTILYLVVCKLWKYYELKLDKDMKKELLKAMLAYSVPLIPNALFWWINSSLDRWVLTFFSGLSIVGLYSCANKIPTILSTINTIFAQAWNLSFFQGYDDEDSNEFFGNVYFYYSEMMFCCSIGIIMLSKIVATFMFSKDFFVAWVFVPLLTAGVFYNSLNAYLGALFTASKKTKYIFTTTLAGSVVNLVLNIPFVYLWGAVGAAVATLISFFVVFIMRVNKIYKMFGIRLNYKLTVFQLLFIIAEIILMMMDRFFIIVFAAVAVYCVIFLVRARKKIKKYPMK